MVHNHEYGSWWYQFSNKDNSRLDLGQGGEGGGSDTIYLSSECPSFLTLDDNPHLESCKGPNVHLDDCAGLYTDNGSYFKIGGSKDEAVIYVKGRDDVKEQHLVFGEKLTEILDLMLASQEALIDTVMSFGIPTFSSEVRDFLHRIKH